MNELRLHPIVFIWRILVSMMQQYENPLYKLVESCRTST